ncbi:MAG: hypothetical protein WC683_01920 [bacterium]
MKDMLESMGGTMRALLERLEAVTRTGVKLQVIPGGQGGDEQPARSTISSASAEPPQGGPSAKKRPLGNAGVPLGKTVEREGLRLHRYTSALRVTDLTNAGKRGKQVDEFALYNLDWDFSLPVASLLEKALGAIATARTYAQALRAAKDAVQEATKLGGSYGAHAVAVEETRLRGVDVEAPAGAPGAKVKIVTPTFELEASAKDFSVRQRAKGLEDTTNHIPPVHGAKRTAIANFYAWVQEHEAQIRRWSYHELARAMADAGLDYHSYSTYD